MDGRIGIGLIMVAALAAGDGQAQDAPSIIIHQRNGEVTASKSLDADVQGLTGRLSALEDDIEQLREMLQAADGKLEKSKSSAAQYKDRMETEVESLREKLKAQTILAEERAKELRSLQEEMTIGRPAEARGSSETATVLENAAELFDQGKMEEAAEAYRAGLARWPGVHGFRLGLATCHYYRGNPDVAATLAEEVLDHDSTHVGALRLLGILAWDGHDYKDAERYFKRALRTTPDDAELHVYRGLALFARGKHRNARQALEQAIELDARFAPAHYNLSVLLASLRDPDLDEARRHYETARSLASDADPELEAILYPQ